MGLSFTVAASPRQRNYSQIRVPQDSWPHFTVSDSRPYQPVGPGPRIYIPQEQGGSFTPPGTGFPFRRLLRFQGLRWRYSTPHWPSRYIVYCDMTPESRNSEARWDVLCWTIARQTRFHCSAQQWSCWEKVFSVRATRKLCNEDLRQLKGKLRESWDGSRRLWRRNGNWELVELQECDLKSLCLVIVRDSLNPLLGFD
jgi:hypothetical protein